MHTSASTKPLYCRRSLPPAAAAAAAAPAALGIWLPACRAAAAAVLLPPSACGDEPAAAAAATACAAALPLLLLPRVSAAARHVESGVAVWSCRRVLTTQMGLVIKHTCRQGHGAPM